MPTTLCMMAQTKGRGGRACASEAEAAASGLMYWNAELSLASPSS